jgi:hypothetical protein
MLSSLSEKALSFDGDQLAKTLSARQWYIKNYTMQMGRPATLYMWAETWAHNHLGPLADLNVNWAQVVSGL